LGRWTHAFSETADFKLQMYYDYTARAANRVFDETRQTFDLTFQNQFAVGNWNRIIWGLGYRTTADTEKNTPGVIFNPTRQTLNLFSGFIQDELELVKDRLSLTLGSKLEHNDYTGVEVEPSGRLAWTPTEHQTFWSSVSRAVRTPSRADVDVTANQAAPTPPFPPGITLSSIGNPSFVSEELLAYEIGYRTAPAKNISFDIAAFYNEYDRLKSIQTVSPFPPTVMQANQIHGDTYGGEISATWRVTDGWRLQPTYSFLKMNLRARSGSTDTTSAR